MTKGAKTTLLILIIGGFLLLGGIAFQMLIGISTMLTKNSIMEQFGGNWVKYRKRHWLVEHIFRTVKRHFGAYYLLTKEIDSVSAEMGLAF